MAHGSAPSSTRRSKAGAFTQFNDRSSRCLQQLHSSGAADSARKLSLAQQDCTAGMGKCAFAQVACHTWSMGQQMRARATQSSQLCNVHGTACRDPQRISATNRHSVRLRQQQQLSCSCLYIKAVTLEPCQQQLGLRAMPWPSRRGTVAQTTKPPRIHRPPSLPVSTHVCRGPLHVRTGTHPVHSILRVAGVSRSPAAAFSAAAISRYSHALRLHS